MFVCIKQLLSSYFSGWPLQKDQQRQNTHPKHSCFRELARSCCSRRPKPCFITSCSYSRYEVTLAIPSALILLARKEARNKMCHGNSTRILSVQWLETDGDTGLAQRGEKVARRKVPAWLISYRPSASGWQIQAHIPEKDFLFSQPQAVAKAL